LHSRHTRHHTAARVEESSPKERQTDNWKQREDGERVPDFKYASDPSAAKPSLSLCLYCIQVVEGGDGKTEGE